MSRGCTISEELQNPFEIIQKTSRFFDCLLGISRSSFPGGIVISSVSGFKTLRKQSVSFAAHQAGFHGNLPEGGDHGGMFVPEDTPLHEESAGRMKHGVVSPGDGILTVTGPLEGARCCQRFVGLLQELLVLRFQAACHRG